MKLTKQRHTSGAISDKAIAWNRLQFFIVNATQNKYLMLAEEINEDGLQFERFHLGKWQTQNVAIN